MLEVRGERIAQHNIHNHILNLNSYTSRGVYFVLHNGMYTVLI